MPRQPRYFIPDLPQHVIQRGVDRQAVFFEPSDYQLYLRSLHKAAKRYECQIHAYVLMINHTHLLVTPGCEQSLPGMMMAMIRLNTPSVFVYGGSILPGRFNGKDVTVQDVFEAVGQHVATPTSGWWISSSLRPIAYR